MSHCIICFDNDLSDAPPVMCEDSHQLCKTCFNVWINTTLTEECSINPDGTINCFSTTTCNKHFVLSDIITYCDRPVIDKLVANLLMSKRKVEVQVKYVEKDLTVNDHLLIIQEKMNKKCPHCGQIFYDFDGCTAIKCTGMNGCSNYFCGICFEPTPINPDQHEADQQAHAHSSKTHGEVFFSKEQIAHLNKIYFRKCFWDYISSIKIEHIKNLVIEQSGSIVVDVLGKDYLLPNSRLAPNYGIYPLQMDQPIVEQPMFDQNNQVLPRVGRNRRQINRDINPQVPHIIEPRILVDRQALLEYEANGMYEIYNQMCKYLNTITFPEDRQANIEIIVNIIKQLEIIKTYLDKIEIRNAALKIANEVKDVIQQQHKVSKLAITRQLYENFFQQPDFDKIIIRQFKFIEFQKIGNYNLELALLSKDEVQELTQEEKSNRNEIVRQLKVILDGEPCAIINTFLNHPDWQ